MKKTKSENYFNSKKNLSFFKIEKTIEKKHL